MAQKLKTEEIETKLQQLKNWRFKENSLQASFKFKDFKETFAKMTRIAFEAEANEHHPEWTNVYNNLSISLSTHDVGGVTQKDFDLAQAIEQII